MQEKDREAVEEKQQEAASTLKGLRQGTHIYEVFARRCLSMFRIVKLLTDSFLRVGMVSPKSKNARPQGTG